MQIPRVVACSHVKVFITTVASRSDKIDEINPQSAKKKMNLKMSSAEVVCCK